jgi:hypothetical protein
MPWWSWVLIWALLVLGLLGMLALFALWLFRKARTGFAALSELGDKVAALEAASEEVARQPFRAAVLAPYDEVREPHRLRADLRADRKRSRRERRLARGKLLTTADLRQRTFNVGQRVRMAAPDRHPRDRAVAVRRS